MKQFIYLDTDIVTSIIAQEEKGFVTQQTQENESDSEKTLEKGVEPTLTIKGEAKVLKLIQAAADLEVSGNIKHTTASGLSTKNVAEKILHDAAFDIAYNYILPTKVQFGNDMVGDSGEYLEITRVYDYVDFTYLETMFDKDGIVEYLKNNEAEEIGKQLLDAANSALNRAETRKAETAIKREKNNLITQNNKKYDSVLKMIKAIKKLIPYDHMLISNDGFLIPLDDKYFRINPANLGFKYGGEITCVGMVTNIIGKDTDPCDDKNIFATLQYSVNEVLRSLLPTQNDNLCVIHPIAVYYGQ